MHVIMNTNKIILKKSLLRLVQMYGYDFNKI